MKSYYSNKVVWVTGASSGIGEYLVYELIQHNARVILSSRRPEELQRVVIASGAAAGQTFILPVDLSDHNSLGSKVDEAVAWVGHVDLLINNGGISQRALVTNTHLSVEKNIFDVNYFGTVELSRHMAKHMIKRRKGHINVVSSVLGKLSVPGRSSYCSSKHALHGYFNALRAELHPHHVTVSIVCPGYIKSNVSINAVTADGSNHQKMDTQQQKGMNTALFAKKMLQKIAQGRLEFNIGGPEIYAIYLMRWMQWLTFRIQRHLKFIE
jgi:dehydrogenase/reductase SDR family protein 7B